MYNPDLYEPTQQLVRTFTFYNGKLTDVKMRSIEKRTDQKKTDLEHSNDSRNLAEHSNQSALPEVEPSNQSGLRDLEHSIESARRNPEPSLDSNLLGEPTSEAKQDKQMDTLYIESSRDDSDVNDHQLFKSRKLSIRNRLKRGGSHSPIRSSMRQSVHSISE